MHALYIEIRKIQEEGIMMRKRPKSSLDLPFLPEANKDDVDESDPK